MKSDNSKDFKRNVSFIFTVGLCQPVDDISSYSVCFEMDFTKLFRVTPILAVMDLIQVALKLTQNLNSVIML